MWTHLTIAAGLARPRRCHRVLGTALLGLGLLPVVAAAQGDPGPVAGKALPRTVTVQVFVHEAVKKQPGPAPKALVRIEGSDDSRETNDKGVVRLSGIAAEKITLQVMVAGADICRLADVAVPVGEGVLKVLVEKGERGQCKLVE